jgi:hypothetical protein
MIVPNTEHTFLEFVPLLLHMSVISMISGMYSFAAHSILEPLAADVFAQDDDDDASLLL